MCDCCCYSRRKLPILQVTVPLFVKEQGVGGVEAEHFSRPLIFAHDPTANSALTKVVPLGSRSVTTTPLAVPGPKFATAMEDVRTRFGKAVRKHRHKLRL